MPVNPTYSEAYPESDSQDTHPPEELIRNHANKKTRSMTGRDFVVIETLKRHIKKLESALRDSLEYCDDPGKRKEYTTLLASDPKPYTPRRYSSKYRGVNWHNASKRWASKLNLNVRSDNPEVYITYHTSELEAALAYDEKVDKHCPERAHYKNFARPGEDTPPPPRWNVWDKRKFIGKHLPQDEINTINSLGIGHFTASQCSLALQHLSKQGVIPGESNPVRSWDIDKTEFIDMVATATGTPRTRIAPIVETIVDSIKEILKKEGSIRIQKFGKFEVRKRKKRDSPVNVPERFVPYFKISKNFAVEVDAAVKQKKDA